MLEAILTQQVHVVNSCSNVNIIRHNSLCAVPGACARRLVTCNIGWDCQIALTNHQDAGVVWAERWGHVELHARAVRVIIPQERVVPMVL